MDLIEEYINNIHGMAMSLDDSGDKKIGLKSTWPHQAGLFIGHLFV